MYRNMRFLMVGASIVFTTGAMAALPFSFTAGGAINASEINANFNYLENLVSSSSYIRAGVSWTSGSTSTETLFSVPGSGPTHLVRSFTTPNCSNGLFLVVGSDKMRVDANTTITGLTIPVAAGETVSVECYTASISQARNAFIVLSR